MIHLDADDVVESEGLEVLRELKKRPIDELAQCYRTLYEADFNENGSVIYSFFRERVFKRSVQPRWKFKIHEKIPMDTFQTVEMLPFTVIHLKPKGLIPQGHSRNIDILLGCLADPAQWNARFEFYLGRDYLKLGQSDQAEQAFRNYLSHWDMEVLAINAYRYLAEILVEKGQLATALETLDSGLKVAPHRKDLLGLKGQVLFALKNENQAIETLEKARQAPPLGKGFGDYNLEWDQWIPDYLLALLHRKIGNLEKSRANQAVVERYAPRVLPRTWIS